MGSDMANIRDGKSFPNQTAAQAAINAAAATWSPAPLVRVGPGPHASDAQIGTRRLADPVEMADGSWAVFDVDHPALRGQSIDVDARKRPTDLPAQAQARGKS